MRQDADRALVADVRARLRAAADAERAPQMQRYMKSALPCLGVRVPQARSAAKAAALARPFASQGALIATVRSLWDGAQYREERYAATALCDTPSARALRGPELLDLYRDLIVDGAWWDHVDELAHRVGELLRAWPDRIRPVVLRWAGEPDMWLRRVSIICQLGARQATDRELLLAAVEANAADREFFVRKAIGWALRDYARTEPAWVRAVVDSHALSPLSRREALKHL